MDARGRHRAALLFVGALLVFVLMISLRRVNSGGSEGRAPEASASSAQKRREPAPAPRRDKKVQASPASSSPAPSSEAELMAQLRALDRVEPARALELARLGNQRFPQSEHRAERAALVVKSLSLLGRFSEARGEAEKMVNQYPGTPWALEVERQTGAHPRRR